MSDSLPNENLIATLEQSLRQTRKTQQRHMVRLKEVEAEADSLRQDIESLDDFAEETEKAIYGLLARMGSGSAKKRPRIPKKKINKEDDYERPAELSEFRERRSRDEEYPRDTRQQDDYYEARLPYDEPVTQQRGGRSVPAVSENIEPISRRFADRTITQACTLLLRESGKPLHVNELYNYLVAGGFEFKGNNPTISIAVSLNRNRRFRKVAPGTFDLVMRDASQAAS